MVFRRDAPDFLQRGNALERFVDSHHAERSHPLADRLVFHHRRGSALDDETANRFAYRKRFDDGDPAQISPVLSTVASASVIENRAFRRRHPQSFENLRFRDKFLAAICAYPPDESLRASHDDRARN